MTTSAAQDQEYQHPHQEDAGRGELEWIDVLRHGVSAPNSPQNKAQARRKEEPGVPGGTFAGRSRAALVPRDQAAGGVRLARSPDC